LAHASSKSLTVFSRDLKYMLDARHSAAPLRRKMSRRAMAALVTIMLVFATWWGMRFLPATGDTTDGASKPGNASDLPLPVVPRVSTDTPKYTQTEQPVSKSGDQPAQEDTYPSTSQDRTAEREIIWESYIVRRGDTLGKIFQLLAIDIGLANRIVKHQTGEALKKLLPDRKLWFGFERNGQLVELTYELDRLEELLVQFDTPDHFQVTQRKMPTDVRENTVSQTIGSSLFVSASAAGLSGRLIMDLVAIFGWDIDFALDIRSGDRFTILYEEMFRNGDSVGTGDILAAEFVNKGTVFRAVLHVDADGHKEYYDLEGNNVRGTFLRTPMKVSRITSGFSKNRYHPVLKKWRAHRGVDYGAPTGTPVLATADGRVHLVGRNGGYGNTIVLKHGSQYSTLYAHLSRYKKGIKRGAEVKQGEVLGYVGSSGLATGPHLHYEFRVNGTHRNPLTYETPKAQSIAERYRHGFLVMAQERMNQIGEARPEQVASR
jgi:murein DD-endopeptidase MepM/ murein hydrolase activator NlpD